MAATSAAYKNHILCVCVRAFVRVSVFVGKEGKEKRSTEIQKNPGNIQREDLMVNSR